MIADASTTVLFMRHCARSTSDTVEGLPYDDYSADAWPNFSVPSMHCLKRGHGFVQRTGSELKDILPKPILTIADNVERDIETAMAFLEGCGHPISATNFFITHDPFSSSSSPSCIIPNVSERVPILAKAINSSLPSDAEEIITCVKDVVGEGNVGDWAERSCEATEEFMLQGNCVLAAYFAERFLMQFMGGMTVGWGRLEPEKIPKLLKMYEWFLHTLLYFDISKKLGASIMTALLEIIKGRPEGTYVFVGHDVTLVQISTILGLSWELELFGTRPNLPGSMLRFDLENEMIQASYIYPDIFAKDNFSLGTTEAKFSRTASDTMLIEDLVKDMQRTVDIDCANPFVIPHTNIV